MLCTHCGADIENGADPCPACGMSESEGSAPAPLPMILSQSVFEPGPSFSEHMPAGSDDQELPNWLQNFGGSVETPLAATVAVSDYTIPTLVEQPPVSDLPGWLAEPRPGVAAPAQASTWDLADVKFGSNEESGFITEDDLPDWLRSIGNEPPPADAAVGTEPTNGVNAAAARMLQTPSVVSAWVTGRTTVALAERESLFAHIAHEEKDGLLATAQAAESGTWPTAVAEQSLAAPVETAALVLGTPSQQRARRYMLYVALAVLLLLVIFLARR